MPSLWIGVVEVSLRWLFPDGNLWFFGFIFDICNDFKFIFIFVFGYGIMAADEHGMKEVIKKGRWYNLIIGKIKMVFVVSLISSSSKESSSTSSTPATSSSPGCPGRSGSSEGLQSGCSSLECTECSERSSQSTTHGYLCSVSSPCHSI